MNSLKSQLFIIILLLLITNSYSQNLINNNSFEDYKKKKKQVIKIEDLKYCYNPSQATPDLLSPYSKNTWWTAPKNATGFQLPHSGESYIGLAIYTGKKYFYYNNNNEYVTIKLNTILESNKLYCASMYVSLADTCFFASDNIGVLLSSGVPYSQGSGPMKINTNELLKEPVVQYAVNYNISKHIVTDKKNWVLICDTIRALGGENYITIGNFKSSDETQFVEVSKVKRTSRLNNDRHTAYYYIDDVSLIEIDNFNECKCQQDLKNDSLITQNSYSNNNLISSEYSIITLNNICFETDKAELLLNSFSILDSVYDILKINSNIKLEIYGYTDNVGKEEYNLKLSESRAMAVVNYFVKNGITNNRLSFKGYGSSNPVASNETEDGRAKNRRVEIKIIKY